MPSDRKRASLRNAWTGLLGRDIANMAPGNFAMVMSTGIVAMAAHNAALPATARLIAFLCALLWAANTALLLIRAWTVPRGLWADFFHEGRSPGFLTIVAGGGVLGSCCVLIFGNPLAGRLFFLMIAALWPILISLILFDLFITRDKLPLEKGLNGAWLLLTVSTQSLVVLGCLLPESAASAPAVLAMAMLFFLGAALYFMLLPLIFYRLFFKELSPEGLSPTFWINAGAMAISCLAGTKLAPLLRGFSELTELAAPVKALAAGAWALATFWLPCLLLLGVWRHLRKKYPFTYSLEYWSVVFPLGMYTVCTQAMQSSYPFFPFAPVTHAALAAALAALLVVFASFCLYLARVLRRASGARPE